MKRGALTLSINMIVILVLAMAVLGLVLGMTRGLFSVGEDRLRDILDKADLSVKGTPTDPLGGGNIISVKKGVDQIIAVSFYNKHQACETHHASLQLECGAIQLSYYKYIESSVPLNTEKTIGGVLKISNSMPSIPVACSYRVPCNGETVEWKTFFLDIN